MAPELLNGTVPGPYVFPKQLLNDENWGWTWTILLTYVISGGGWILGYLIFIPLTYAIWVYMFIMLIYATILFLLEELLLNDFLNFPFRRFWVQTIIMMAGYILLMIPGVSLISLPLLGVLAIWDFLDYQSWEYVELTLSIPFNPEETTVDDY